MLRQYGLYLMAILYMLAGCNHFRYPEMYLAIMPSCLPAHLQLVYISGVCEVLCGILLLLSATRVAGAWLTTALLVAVFPANVQMAVHFYREQHAYLWLAILRIPVQALLIGWAWLYTRPVSNPG